MTWVNNDWRCILVWPSFNIWRQSIHGMTPSILKILKEILSYITGWLSIFQHITEEFTITTYVEKDVVDNLYACRLKTLKNGEITCPVLYGKLYKTVWNLFPDSSYGLHIQTNGWQLEKTKSCCQDLRRNFKASKHKVCGWRWRNTYCPIASLSNWKQWYHCIFAIDHLTIADLPLVMGTVAMVAMDFSLDNYPHVHQWFSNFQESEPKLWAIAKEGLDGLAFYNKNPRDMSHLRHPIHPTANDENNEKKVDWIDTFTLLAMKPSRLL